MKVQDILNDERLALPKCWKSLGKKSYQAAVSEISSDYLEMLKQLDENELRGIDKYLGEYNKTTLLEGCQNVCKAVNETIRVYLAEGNPHRSADVMKTFLTRKDGSPAAIQMTYFMEVRPVTTRPWYRLRPSNEKLEPNDIFHVPFDQRHKIAACRYSIPGYPTLYLSSSVLTAYRELNDPLYEGLQISKFELCDDFKGQKMLLDLSVKPFTYLDGRGETYKYLCRWPLVMACTLKVAFPDSPFKPEYILPQIFLQLAGTKYRIGGQRVRGVYYTSTKVKSTKKNIVYNNSAIPVDAAEVEGYCENLSKMFTCTKPMTFGELLLKDADTTFRKGLESVFVNGAEVDYAQTDFCKLEEVLKQEPTYFLDDPKNPFIPEWAKRD